MSNVGKWETVVNKKKSHITKSDVKKAQQKFIEGEKVPKVEQRDPIKLDDTVYSVGFESPKFQDNNDYTTDDEKYPSRLPYDNQDTSSKSPRIQKKREKKSHKQQPVFDMEGKIKKIDCTVLRNQLKDIEAKFPGQHLIWLKDIASWLQSQLTGPNEKGDIAYLNKKENYPLCELTEEARCILTKLLKRCDSKILSAYFVSLMASLTTEVQQGHCTVGCRILIQLLCSLQPNVLVDCCNEVVHGKSRNGDNYLSVIWAFSQVTASIESGMAVWWSAMFSVLDKKHHAAAAVHYFDKLMNLFQNSTIGKSLLTPDQMVQLLEVMVGEKSPLQHTPSLMDTMRRHFEMLTRIMLSDKKVENAENVFSQLLPVLRQHEDANVKYMICKLLLECLCASSKCYDWWIENLLRHMKESSVFLKYIQSEKQDVTQKLALSGKYRRGDMVYRNSSRMIGILEKANERGRFEKKAGFKECKKLCAAFIRDGMDRKQQSSILWSIVKYVLLALITISSVDLYKSGGYTDSRTSFYLKKYGVEQKYLSAYQCTTNAANDAYTYATKHTPYYYGKVSCYVDPVLNKLSEYATISGKYLYKHSTPVRDYLNKVLPPIFEKISYFLAEQYRITSGLVIANFEYYAPLAQETLNTTYAWFSVKVPEGFSYMRNVILTTKSNIYELNPQMFDNISVIITDAWNYVLKMTPVVLESVGNYTTVCVSTVKDYVSQGHSWMQQHLASASPAAAK